MRTKDFYDFLMHGRLTEVSYVAKRDLKPHGQATGQMTGVRLFLRLSDPEKYNNIALLPLEFPSTSISPSI
jgi:hypothetical protein